MPVRLVGAELLARLRAVEAMTRNKYRKKQKIVSGQNLRDFGLGDRPNT